MLTERMKNSSKREVENKTDDHSFNNMPQYSCLNVFINGTIFLTNLHLSYKVLY